MKPRYMILFMMLIAAIRLYMDRPRTIIKQPVDVIGTGPGHAIAMPDTTQMHMQSVPYIGKQEQLLTSGSNNLIIGDNTSHAITNSEDSLTR